MLNNKLVYIFIGIVFFGMLALIYMLKRQINALNNNMDSKFKEYDQTINIIEHAFRINTPSVQPKINDPKVVETKTDPKTEPRVEYKVSEPKLTIDTEDLDLELKEELEELKQDK